VKKIFYYNLLYCTHETGKDYHGRFSYIPGSKKWNEWFQDRPGDIPQSTVKGAIGLDYSTFLEAVLMNYAAATTPKSKLSEDMFLKWKAYRTFSGH